jgi:hypothetical protein
MHAQFNLRLEGRQGLQCRSCILCKLWRRQTAVDVMRYLTD